MPTDISLDEAIHTQRAIRHFKPDPVDDNVIEELIEAATRAPNGGNQQPAGRPASLQQWAEHADQHRRAGDRDGDHGRFRM